MENIKHMKNMKYLESGKDHGQCRNCGNFKGIRKICNHCGVEGDIGDTMTRNALRQESNKRYTESTRMANIKKLNCGCDNNYLCLKAELLWDRANKIHDVLGFEAWKDCSELQEYNAHRKELYT